MATQKKQPYKSGTFEIYVRWKAIPYNYKQLLPQARIKIGIDDPDLLKLYDIKTQEEFAEIYDIDVGTLSDWNKRIKSEELNKPHYAETMNRVFEAAFASFGVDQIKKPTPGGIKTLFDVNSKMLASSQTKDTESKDADHGHGRNKMSHDERWYTQVSKVLEAVYGDRKKGKQEEVYGDNSETGGPDPMSSQLNVI